MATSGQSTTELGKGANQMRLSGNTPSPGENIKDMNLRANVLRVNDFNQSAASE